MLLISVDLYTVVTTRFNDLLIDFFNDFMKHADISQNLTHGVTIYGGWLFLFKVSSRKIYDA